ncbi:ESPR-type extended signal peptide-containing protein [Stenotrophomonas mori]|uniref:YadA-like family protein n=1 Tax=Stenotrophomonas mori TaxID=2871096 RepID=A0ABT0SEL1_9GAMM|nr:ESPR-type extended signal peptide-containing protein [Stenotrophomonas mori]MCL7713518.1 YadA-like family protein [Stenotrophomonas mori]
MNRIYRLVWNHALNAFVVASELSSGHGKRAARRLRPLQAGSALGLGGMLALGLAGPAQAGDVRLDDLQALVAKYATQDAPVTAPGAAAVVPAVVHVPAPVQASLPVPAAATVRVPAAARSTAAVRARVAVPKPLSQVATTLSSTVARVPATVGRLPKVVETGVHGSVATVATAAQGLGSVLRPGKNDDGRNPLRHTVVSTVGAVEELTGDVTRTSGVGDLLDGVVGGVAPVLEEVGDTTGSLLGKATGSSSLGDGVSQTVATVSGGLKETTGKLGKGNVGGAVQSLLGTVGGTLSSVTGAVTGTLGGLTGSASGLDGLQQVLDGVTGGLTGGLSNVVGQLTGQPPAPAAGGGPVNTGPTGLVVGNGGLVGTVDQLLGPTLENVFGGDGYLRNGSLTLSSANLAQAYSVTSVAGIPLVNLSPVGDLLDGLGGLTTGGNSHLTLIGGVTSDSYVYNINNGKPNGLLGLLLPDSAPAWASTCADPLGLGVLTIDCWGVPAAQDYQVLIGDGAYANGSKEVVIGTNAEHRLAQQDADTVFTGSGNGRTGVPTADYDARQGHSVVIGDSAAGSANAQTLVGAGATSDKANSVALGHKSNADRGGLDNYAAFGLSAPQNSIGEVAVGSVGRERQITHVAAGREATDAVNVAQLKGALAQIDGVELFAVTYDEDAQGDADHGSVTLGAGNAPDGTVVGNLGAGAVAAGSRQAVNGGQLFGLGDSLADLIGGGAVVNADGTVSAPSYGVNYVDGNGLVSLQQYSGIGDAFDSISDSLSNLSGLVDGSGQPGGSPGSGTDALAVHYTADANGKPTNEVVLRGAGDGNAVALRNVAAGSVDAGSSDAVNGAQLAGTHDAVAAAMGGGMGYDSAAGQWTGPSFNITTIDAGGGTQQQTLGNVGDALEALDGSIVNVNQRIDNIQSGGAGNAYFSVNSSKAPASASGQDSMAAGPQATASGKQSVALGDGAKASADGSVALGAGAVADRANAVSVGSSGSERQIVHVADATGATDAVNLRQLQASQQGTVRYDQNTDGSTNYSSVTLGKANAPVVMHNVAAGVAGTDAVNVAQLNKGLGEVVDWSKNYTDQRFNDVGRQMSRIDNRASAGIASAMAMAGLPQPTGAGRRMASFAASTFHGESSMAVGISGVSEGGRWIYKLSGSTNTRGDGGVTAGAGFQW